MNLFCQTDVFANVTSCNEKLLLGNKSLIKGIVSRDTVVCQLNQLVASLGLNNLLVISFTPEKSCVKKK
jgi:hypothetical protein